MRKAVVKMLPVLRCSACDADTPIRAHAPMDPAALRVALDLAPWEPAPVDEYAMLPVIVRCDHCGESHSTGGSP